MIIAVLVVSGCSNVYTQAVNVEVGGVGASVAEDTSWQLPTPSGVSDCLVEAYIAIGEAFLGSSAQKALDSNIISIDVVFSTPKDSRWPCHSTAHACVITAPLRGRAYIVLDAQDKWGVLYTHRMLGLGVQNIHDTLFPERTETLGNQELLKLFRGQAEQICN